VSIRNKLLGLAASVFFASCLASAQTHGIPLCPGLTIVTAVSQPEGDYESIKRIGSTNGSVVHLKYSNEVPVRGPSGGAPVVRKLLLDRNIHLADMRAAKLYLQQFATNIPNDVPGTTAIGASSAVLSALKSKGEAELGVFSLPPAFPGGTKIPADPKVHPNVFDSYETYKLRRVESGPVMVPVIVNDVKTELPAIHAIGRSDYYGYKAEFYFLDDESNPLSLKFRLGIGAGRAQTPGTDRDTLQVVKIAYQCSTQSGPGRLERALLETGRADVYDIYFSFNSDEIREESEPTLREIHEVLRRHPDWKLSISGHTDNIASDTFNLDLSKRRSAAVKNALVTGFGVNGGRLATSGYGKSHPVDTNETPEGRARNRRVELVRQ
jgi:outer membrane protein OmpA-like peptidoglycan-associated protein